MARRATENNVGHSAGAAMRHVNQHFIFIRHNQGALTETAIHLQKRLTLCSHPRGVPDGTFEESCQCLGHCAIPTLSLSIRRITLSGVRTMYKSVFFPGFNISVFAMANSGFSYHHVFLQ